MANQAKLIREEILRDPDQNAKTIQERLQKRLRQAVPVGSIYNQRSMLRRRGELPTKSEGEQPQAEASDPAANGTAPRRTTHRGLTVDQVLEALTMYSDAGRGKKRLLMPRKRPVRAISYDGENIVIH